MELPAELKRRVALAYTQYSLEFLPAGDCVWLACDLLSVGVDGPAVAELAAAPPDLTRLDGTPLVAAMFDELGLPPVDMASATWFTARDIASRMLSGELDLAAGGNRLESISARLGSPDELQAIDASVTQWEILRAVGADESETRVCLTRLAEDVLGEAAERLGR